MEIRTVYIAKRWRPACLALVGLSLLVIFAFSAQSGETSGSLSRQVARMLADTLYRGAAELPDAAFDRLHHAVRKLAHATEYGLLAFSCALTLLTFPASVAARNAISAGVCFVCACADEFQQTLQPGRSGAFADVLIDMSGALAVLLMLYILHRAVRMRRARKRSGGSDA